MPLSVSYLPDAQSALAEARAHIDRATQAADLFGEIHVLVPTIGMRWWLTEQLASTLGASGKADGVVANMKFHMPTVLSRGFFATREDQPWSEEVVIALLFEHFAMIQETSNTTASTNITTFIDTSGGTFSAAARLAGMFSKYSSRRLAMLRLWAKGQPSLMPVASESGGEDLAPELAVNDLWQFEAWRYIYERINEPHPRLDTLINEHDTVSHLLVFGFETLDHDTIHLLRRYGGRAEVTVLMLTPSSAVVNATAPSIATSPSEVVAPRARRVGETFPDELSKTLQLPFHWYRGVRETLQLLGASGIKSANPTVAFANPTSTLSCFQTAIRAGVRVDVSKVSIESAEPLGYDDSIELHLCHGKARQAEVAADAVLAALQNKNLKNLQFHDIAIVTPDIASMAPHLQAAFGKEVTLEFEPSVVAGLDKESLERQSKIKLPVVIADRSLGELNDGAQFFLDFLSLIGGRADKAEFFDLIQQSEFARIRGLGIEQFDRWSLMTERAEQRWAINDNHRAGFVGVKTSDKHTWLNTSLRVLLGALATRDSELPTPELVPILDVDAEELPDVLLLIELIDAVSGATRDSAIEHTLSEWSDILGQHLRRLCGSNTTFSRVPMSELEVLRRIGMMCETPAKFLDVRKYLQGRFGAVPAASYRRDGRILVTNMTSQHLVPHRVICVVGLDDSSIPAGALDGNDLTGRQVVQGDTDARHDLRRQILDAIMSASDRVILTCDGRSAKNNQKIDLIPPLIELLEFGLDVGAEIGKRSHPRHRMSEKNFMNPVDNTESLGAGHTLGRPWSYDSSARDIVRSSRVTKRVEVKELVVQPPQAAAPISVKDLSKMLNFPLTVYLEQQLKVYSIWEDEEVDYGMVPLELERPQFADLLRQLLADGTKEGTTAEDGIIGEWRRRDLLPLTEASKLNAIGEIKRARNSINDLLTYHSISTGAEEKFDKPLRVAAEQDYRLPLPSGQVLDHRIPILGTEETTVLLLSPDRIFKEGNLIRIYDEFALGLIFALAAGVNFEKWNVIAESSEWPSKEGSQWIRFEVDVLGLSGSPVQHQQKAAAWLDQLVALWKQCATIPIPTFGERRGSSVGKTFFVDGKRDDAEEAFFKFVAPNRFGKSFSQSDEGLIFGAEPEFDDCFVKESAAEKFWQSRSREWLVQPVKVRSQPQCAVTVQQQVESTVGAKAEAKSDD